MKTLKIILRVPKIIGITGAMLMFIASAGAQSKPDESKTIKGEVVDMNCYMDHGAHGAKHAACAATCIKNGSPVGILTADGKVYLIVADHSNEDPYDQVRKYPAQQVTVTGRYENRGGVQALVIESVKTSD